jgi:hypothetical protein
MLKYMIGIFILSILGSYSLISKNNEQFQIKKIQTTIVANQIVTEEIVENDLSEKIIFQAIENLISENRVEKEINDENKVQVNEKKTASVVTKKKEIKKVINTKDVENLDFINTHDEVVKNKNDITNKEVKFVKIVKKYKVEKEEIKKVKSYKQRKNEELFDEAYFNINGSDPIKPKKITKIIKISNNNLVALLDNIKMPKEEKQDDVYLVDFDNSKVAPIKKENTKIYRKPTVDRISTALAANEKSKEKNKEEDLDLTFYDYSKSDEDAESQKAPTMKEKIESLMRVSVSSQSEKKSTTERKVNPLVTQNSVSPAQPVKVDVPKKPKAKLPRLPKLPKLPDNNRVASNDQEENDRIKGLDFEAN